MKSRELDRLLGIADELVDARARQARLDALEREVAHDRKVVKAVPGVVDAVCARREPIEAIARELEEQWVSQGPLVSAWQRAVELSQLAEGSGADPVEYQADVDRARRRVETARLGTRELLDSLTTERGQLVDAIMTAPFDLPCPPAVRDDGRPEAARRDALGLIDLADEVVGTAREEGTRAKHHIVEATAEAQALGDPAELTERIAELERALPDEVELPPSAPPSSEMRLRRAGVRVRGQQAV